MKQPLPEPFDKTEYNLDLNFPRTKVGIKIEAVFSLETIRSKFRSDGMSTKLPLLLIVDSERRALPGTGLLLFICIYNEDEWSEQSSSYSSRK